jgi:glucose-1-phosphate adenylyltransferase
MDYNPLLARHAASGADLTIATAPCPVEDASRFGVIESEDGRVIAFTEKPPAPRAIPARPNLARVSMGVYVFRTDALIQYLEECCETGGQDFGRDIIPRVVSVSRAFAHDFVDPQSGEALYWRDIGTLDGYFQASMDTVDADPLFDPFVNDLHPSRPARHPAAGKIASARAHATARVERSVVSSGVEIGSGAVIEESVLMPGVRVGRGARLRRTIVAEGLEIPAGFSAGFDLGHDRQLHAVTPGGVVVVHQVPNARPAVASSMEWRYPQAAAATA